MVGNRWGINPPNPGINHVLSAHAHRHGGKVGGSLMEALHPSLKKNGKERNVSCLTGGGRWENGGRKPWGLGESWGTETILPKIWEPRCAVQWRA